MEKRHKRCIVMLASFDLNFVSFFSTFHGNKNLKKNELLLT